MPYFSSGKSFINPKTINDMNRYILSVLAAMAVTASSASVAEFSFNPDGGALHSYGSGLKERYDVAIRLCDPKLAGTAVTGLAMPMNVSSGISDMKGWVSSELMLDDRKNNITDLAEAEAVFEDGVMKVSFPHPCVVPSWGFYVGFSFTVDNVDTPAMENPLMLSINSDDPDGFFMHSSRSHLKWIPMSEDLHAVLDMTVTLDGDFKPDAASVSVAQAYGEKGGQSPVRISVSNAGNSEIESVGYSYVLSPSGLTGEGEVKFTSPIPACLGAGNSAVFKADVPQSDELQTIRVTLTKVNGQPNALTSAMAEADLIPVPFVPINRPLVDEYTGTWCGYCPRGFIALEEMNRRYPDEFIAASFHNGDVMTITGYYPYPVSGLPSATLNRKVEVDPYYGSSSDTPMGIDADWQAMAAGFCPAEINASLAWQDDSMQTLVLKSATRFVFDSSDIDYSVSYMIVADGLTAPSKEAIPDWMQSNYYANSEPDIEGIGWEQFCNAGSSVPGFVFNDVVVFASEYSGYSEAVPYDIVSCETYTHEITVPVSDIINIEGESLMQDNARLRVIAVLMNADTNEVINCGRSGFVSSSGVSTLKADNARVVKVICHDLTGRQVTAPVPGSIGIRTEILSDGTSRSVKQKF